MLRDLFIKDFAIIKEIEINFTKGLNVLTGETGAGKSILIDAVGQLLGERARSEFIRTGCEKAFVQGIFELPPNTEISSILNEIGIEEEDDGILMLSREVSINGRNKCRINGVPTTLSVFRSVGKKLIDIHGQHSHQSLLNEDKQLMLLDSFGGKKILDLKKEVKDLYTKISKKNKELQELLGYERDGLREKDLLQFQLQEIDGENLLKNEEEELLEERKRLDGSQELASGCEIVNDLLYAGNNCAYDNISRSVEILQNLVQYDANLQDSLEELNNAIYSVEEVSRTIRNYRELIEFDPERLNYINKRLDTINNLKRKYGNSIEEILKYRDQVAASLEKIENSSDKIQEIESELEALNEL
ncbi:MAG: repair protein RecN, partial [Clostridia bacterium]|nr:repair protein RecN [Clostridia bacterium]